jgi:hypothetical protein
MVHESLPHENPGPVFQAAGAKFDHTLLSIAHALKPIATHQTHLYRCFIGERTMLGIIFDLGCAFLGRWNEWTKKCFHDSTRNQNPFEANWISCLSRVYRVPHFAPNTVVVRKKQGNARESERKDH